MKSTLFSLALAAGAIATPTGLLEKRTYGRCISNAEATKFMTRFTSILQHVDSDMGDYVTTAQKLLTDDFHEISDSINMLANKPLGSVTADKATYISGAQHAPPTTGIENLAVTVSNCNNLIWEWNMNGVGKATYPVKGIGLFKLVRSGRLGLKIQAQELKLEFNNIAWGLDTGYGWVKQDGTLLGRAPNPAPAADPAPATSESGTTDDSATTDDSTTEQPSTDTSSTDTTDSTITAPSADTDNTSATTDGQTDPAAAPTS